MAPKYKLTYFNIRGMAEPIRFLLSYGGADFEDVRIEKEDWPKVKPNIQFGKVPILEVDGKTVHQSGAICRYLAKQFGINGKDDWEALQIDIVVDTFVDFKSSMSSFHHETDETLKAKKKETFLKETLPFYLSKFEEIVKNNGGHFVGGKLTWADIVWVSMSDSFKLAAGFEVTKGNPNLKALHDKVMALPAIKAWVAKRPDSIM